MIDHLGIVHDTVRVTKIIIDTVKAPSKDSMDLLYKMDSFYNNAWTKLILVVTIAFAIIGIVVPVLIQWYQKRELKLGEEKLRDDIKITVDKATKGFTKYVDEQVQRKFDELDLKVTKHVKKLDGRTYQLQANSSLNQADNRAIGSYLAAIRSFYEGDDMRQVTTLLKYILSDKVSLKLFSKTIAEESFKFHNINYRELFKHLVEKDQDGEIEMLTDKVASILDSLK